MTSADPIFALVERERKTHEAWEAFKVGEMARLQAAGLINSQNESEIVAPHFDPWLDAENAVVEARVHTLEGVRAKLPIMRRYVQEGGYSEHVEDFLEDVEAVLSKEARS